jgi:hypothetical protein
MMKKIAIYVEGQTEQFFINKLLIEIAGQKNIAIELKKFCGKNAPTRDIYPKTTAQPLKPKYSALIYDCGGDESVKPRIIEDYSGLVSNGYSKIIGIRDLFPQTDLVKLERGLNFNISTLPISTEIIVAVHEIESWFLSECTHFERIDNRLTNAFIISNCNYDPCSDDMTLFPNPAKDLRNIYQLVGKTYNKDKKIVERTVECLDYANLYLNVRHKIIKMDELINRIDTFLA